MNNNSAIAPGFSPVFTLKSLCCQEFNISMTDFDGKSRRIEIVTARKTFATILHNSFPKWGPVRIGKIMGRTHATILHYYKTTQDRLDTEKKFTEQFNRISNHYTTAKKRRFEFTMTSLRDKLTENSIPRKAVSIPLFDISKSTVSAAV